jgi:hypothetical protein
MKRLLFLLLAFLYIVSLVGCTSLKTRIGADHVPSLVEKELGLKIGMELLKDRRPAVDKKFTADIKDVPSEVTEKLIEYLTATGPIKQISFPAGEDSDIIIAGTIHRFMWRAYNKAPTYIPLINLYVYLGIPCKTAYSMIHITLELRDNRTGRVIDSFDEYAKVVKNYNLYDYKKVDYAIELQQSFRQVASRLKKRIISRLRLVAPFAQEGEIPEQAEQKPEALPQAKPELEQKEPAGFKTEKPSEELKEGPLEDIKTGPTEALPPEDVSEE